jgi:acyl-CoA synthetase (NDP forming)
MTNFERKALTSPEAKLVSDACGIPVPGEGVANSPAEATQLASTIGYPVVMKIVSPEFSTKPRPAE